MKILLLAPEPFYENRGTPIAVTLMLRGLSERGDQVEVITYHQGTEVRYENVTVHRIPNLPFVRRIRPGFSWKKIICDLFMFVKVLRLASSKRYDLVHAVEESVFMALFLKWIFKMPYVYDMDSSLAQQMVEKYAFLNRFAVVLKFFEKLAVKNAEVVTPVCEALAQVIEEHRPKKVAVLPDVSLLHD
jgi:Glycosyltransferase Family 4